MPDTSSPGRPLPRPALVSVAVTAVAAMVFAAVSASGALSGSRDQLGPSYTVWATVVTFGATLWIALLAQGVRVLRERPEPWRRARAWWTVATGCYVTLAVVAGGMLRWITTATVDDGPSVPGWLVAALVPVVVALALLVDRRLGRMPARSLRESGSVAAPTSAR